MKRDWAADVKNTDIKFLSKQQDYIFCEKDGFTFMVHRSNWPPVNLSPSQCTEPSEYYKFQVKQVHGDKYDLSVTNFTGADNNVNASCEKHGIFTIPAKYLKSIRGCPHCGNENMGLKSRSTTEEFINKSKVKHGDKYDYSLVEYSTVKTKVKLICKDHGEFTIDPSNHLSGKGCSLCGLEASALSRALSQETVIQRFKERHGERYDYSLVKYTGDAHGKLIIVCKEHGIFEQSYANHNSGKGCPICAKEFSPRLRSGFIRSYESKKYASLYLLNCFNEDENFYKIGITTKPVRRRFGGKSTMPYEYDVIHLFKADGSEIWDLEKLLHRKYRDFKYVPNLEFGGMYECFSHIDVPSYSEFLQTESYKL